MSLRDRSYIPALVEAEEARDDERDRRLARRDRIGEMSPARYATFGGSPRHELEEAA